VYIVHGDQLQELDLNALELDQKLIIGLGLVADTVDSKCDDTCVVRVRYLTSARRPDHMILSDYLVRWENGVARLVNVANTPSDGNWCAFDQCEKAEGHL
jgi:hypothetical protein